MERIEHKRILLRMKLLGKGYIIITINGVKMIHGNEYG
jgi:hypothetical protein